MTVWIVNSITTYMRLVATNRMLVSNHAAIDSAGWRISSRSLEVSDSVTVRRRLFYCLIIITVRVKVQPVTTYWQPAQKEVTKRMTGRIR